MTDLLLELSRFPLAKSALKKLSLPMPQNLARPKAPWGAAPLAGRSYAIGAATENGLVGALAKIVGDAGGETVHTYDPERRLKGLVFDATGLASPGELGSLYEFIKPRLSSLGANGRVVLVGATAGDGASPETAAAQLALVGFAKSLGKEVGRRGGTVQVVNVDPKGKDVARRLAWPLTYFLSDGCAYVSGQVVTLHALTPAQAASAGGELLAGKTALVTGAARGIGAAIANKLADEGARVVGLDRPQELERLKQVVGPKGIAWGVDLLSPTAVGDIVNKVEQELGTLDILVNNAGITRDKTLARMPRDWWDDTIAVNLTVPLALTEALAVRDGSLIQLMPPGSRVVFLSSINGIGGNGGQSNYAAAKSGLIGATRALAHRFASRGITVNAVAPGFIETEMTAKIPLPTREIARRLNALSQAGTPSDVADTVTFYAAPEAFAVTGQVVRVCGLNLLGA